MVLSYVLLLGGAVKLARNDADIDKASVSANFGYHDNEQVIHATIGKGNVEVGGKPLEDDKVNRDLSKTKKEWGDKLKEVKVELVLLDGEKIARKFDNIKNTWSDPEGYIKGKVEGFSEELGKAKEKVQETWEDVKSSFGSKPAPANDNDYHIDDEEIEEIIDLDEIVLEKENKPKADKTKANEKPKTAKEAGDKEKAGSQSIDSKLNSESRSINDDVEGLVKSKKIFISLDDNNKPKVIDNSDLNDMSIEMKKTFNDMLSNALNTIEATVEKLAQAMDATKGQARAISKPFFVLGFGYSWFNDYQAALNQEKEKADAMIESAANTWVNAIINVGAGSAVAVGASGLVTIAGAPVILATGTGIFIGVAAGHYAEKWFTKEGTLRNDIVNDIKRAMSDTLKSTPELFKNTEEK